MNRQVWLAAFAVSLGVACTPAAAAYTSIFAFGDSLSDAGNLFAESEGTIPLKPYVAGHFSNGPTWVEDLSQMLGLGPMKPFLTSNDGTNYAFGGAQTGITDINPFDPTSPVHIDFPDQITAFNLVDPNPVKGALYTLDIGANDILNALAALSRGRSRRPTSRRLSPRPRAIRSTRSALIWTWSALVAVLRSAEPGADASLRRDGASEPRQRFGGIVQRRQCSRVSRRLRATD